MAGGRLVVGGRFSNRVPVAPVKQPRPIQGATDRRVVQVISNRNGVITFAGGMQVIGVDEPYDSGDRVLVVNNAIAGRMPARQDIEKVYI